MLVKCKSFSPILKIIRGGEMEKKTHTHTHSAYKCLAVTLPPVLVKHLFNWKKTKCAK